MNTSEPMDTPEFKISGRSPKASPHSPSEHYVQSIFFKDRKELEPVVKLFLKKGWYFACQQEYGQGRPTRWRMTFSQGIDFEKDFPKQYNFTVV
jgi:hypothetical protein